MRAQPKHDKDAGMGAFSFDLLRGLFFRSRQSRFARRPDSWSRGRTENRFTLFRADAPEVGERPPGRGRALLAQTFRCLFVAFLLAGCGRNNFHMTDISGAMPKLDFRLARASDGAAASGRTYRGKVVVLYFGYTNCPDICPTTLTNLTEMLAKVRNPNVRVLFVTVDPDRDTLPVLKAYAAAFSPQIDGLRGTGNALADLARRYRVAYSVKVGPPYEVMHSNAVFFFDKNGNARLVTTDTNDATAMAEDVKRLLN
jgi:protein SCO1/2